MGRGFECCCQLFDNRYARVRLTVFDAVEERAADARHKGERFLVNLVARAQPVDIRSQNIRPPLRRRGGGIGSMFGVLMHGAQIIGSFVIPCNRAVTFWEKCVKIARDFNEFRCVFARM